MIFFFINIIILIKLINFKIKKINKILIKIRYNIYEILKIKFSKLLKILIKKFSDSKEQWILTTLILVGASPLITVVLFSIFVILDVL